MLIPKRLRQSQLILQKLASGSQSAYRKFYYDHHKDFIEWSMKFGRCEYEDAQDIFQEAMLILSNKIKSGALTEENLTCTLRTFLFGIGKNLFYKNRSKNARYDFVEEINDEFIKKLDLSFEYSIDSEHQKTIFQLALERLSEKERKIIHRFYYDRFCIGAIQRELGYGSENVVRVKKLKSIVKLREIIHNHFREELVA